MAETEEQRVAERCGRFMAEHDRFARLLGIELEAVGEGRCRATMSVTEEMVNGFGSTHGGVTYALADFAFAVACNSRGRVAVALATQMSYPAASFPGDTLVADAVEESLGGRTGLYRIEVRRAVDDRLVGLFTGTAFRTRDAIGAASTGGAGSKVI